MESDSGQDSVRKTGRLLVAARVCGLAPLVTGVAIFLAWISLRWESLVAAETITVVVGAPLVAAGLVCLAVYEFRAMHRKTGVERSKRLFAFAILLANIPAAKVMIDHYFVLTSRPYIITVCNGSSSVVESMTLRLVEARIECPEIGRDEMRTFVLDPDVQCSGSELFYEASTGSDRFEGVADPYCSTYMGGHALILFSDDGVRTGSDVGIYKTGLTRFGGETLHAQD